MGETGKPKKVRRKVIKSEQAYGSRVPGWLLDLECGHFVEIHGWGDGTGIAAPSTTICLQCSQAANAKSKKALVTESV